MYNYVEQGKAAPFVAMFYSTQGLHQAMLWFLFSLEFQGFGTMNEATIE